MTRKLRNADELITPAIAEALEALELTAEDAGVARLARAYAEEIDATPAELRREALEKLGPRLLTALEQMGATPKARGAAGKPVDNSGGKLAQLRATRSS